jgi:hypothetical protein
MSQVRARQSDYVHLFRAHITKISLSNVAKYRVALHARSLGKKRDEPGLLHI